jgi:DNA-binding HxlR family transcriptional regulator
MDMINKNADTLKIIGSSAATLVMACMWLNSKFNEIDRSIGQIEQRLVRIETVLIMQGIMPKDLARNETNE